MKTTEFKLTRYDAEDGMVFDWADAKAHQYKEEDGTVIQEHLYAKTIFVGGNDSINNYIEVEEPVAEVTETTEGE